MCFTVCQILSVPVDFVCQNTNWIMTCTPLVSLYSADQNITPREVIRDFIELLDLLYQHPDMNITQLLESEEFSYAPSGAVSDETAAGFAEFTI